MEIECITVKVDANDKKNDQLIEKLKSKTPMGRFRWPVLEVSDADSGRGEPLYISEALSIAKFWSQDKCGFYGPDPLERAKVD
jgi:hypothetical protein